MRLQKLFHFIVKYVFQRKDTPRASWFVLNMYHVVCKVFWWWTWAWNRLMELATLPCIVRCFRVWLDLVNPHYRHSISYRVLYVSGCIFRSWLCTLKSITNSNTGATIKFCCNTSTYNPLFSQSIVYDLFSMLYNPIWQSLCKNTKINHETP